MTEIIFIVVKQKTEKYTLTQNGPQSALTIWRYTSEKKIRDCLVDTWKPIQLFIGKLGNFLAKCLCICWKLQKILFIFKKNMQTYLLKFWKPQNERNRFKRKNAIQTKNKTKVYLKDQIARFQTLNSRRNCYIL